MAKTKKKFVLLEGDEDKVIFIKGRRALVYNCEDCEPEDADTEGSLEATFSLTHVRQALKALKGNQDAIDAAADVLEKAADVLEKAAVALEKAEEVYDEADQAVVDAENEREPDEIVSVSGAGFDIEVKDELTLGIGCSEVSKSELEEIQDLLLG